MAPTYYGLYVSSCHCRVEVLDCSKSAVLYSAKIQPSKPQLYIFRPSTRMPCEELVALATLSRFSLYIDIRMRNGQYLKMRRNNLFSSVSTLEVAGFGWGWRRDGPIRSDLRLIDVASNQTIATFHKNSSWPGKMLGTFAVFGTHRSPIIDAIIVTGLAKIGHQRLVQSMASP